MTKSRSVIVGADRGGVSKTLVTSAIVDSVLHRGGKLRLIEYEVEPRIGQIVGELEGLGEIESRPVAMEHVVAGDGLGDDDLASANLGKWDEIFADLAEGGRIFDTAANTLSEMVDAIIAQAEGLGNLLGAGENLGFVIPATAERYSYASVPGLIGKIRKAFPAAPIWLVENLRDGGFKDVTAAYATVRNQAQVVVVPNYNTALSVRLTLQPLSTLLKVEREDLQAMYDLGIGPAAREVMFLRRFAKGLAGAVDPISAWFVGQEAVTTDPKAPFPSAA